MTATTPRPDITGRHHTSSLGDDAFAGEPDDPRVQLDRDVGVFEPVPPYPPRTEREAEFYTLRDGEMFSSASLGCLRALTVMKRPRPIASTLTMSNPPLSRWRSSSSATISARSDAEPLPARFAATN